ncbi:pentapeptide repeat-containing protein [Aliarcobacter cryaerophilus]|uniref:pentapeptide repeat-containing protein n=1 Tax=Aliarcobacter cryaerophilus TaxID=28198 RepID=UPI000826AB4B|nr:pentapeptide repeat-containing protein [Aliarcobacter cryaerophilus]
MAKCSCENCDLEVFENSYKCILHCKKDDSSNMNFWNEFNRYISTNKKKSIKISNFIFPCVYKEDFEELLNKNYFQISFYQCQFNNIDLNDVIFNSNILFQNCQFNNIDLTGTKFNYLEFNSITEAKKIYFSSMKVNGRFELNNCTFDDNVYFGFSEFNDNVVFTKTVFKENINFHCTTFDKLAIFKNLNFEKKLNLEDTIFKDKTKFLKLEADVANRETARIIKDSFEKQNNILEANKYYALEMKEREKELEKDLKNGKNFFEWLVFKIHGISSNHSQDWLLTLFWIISFTFLSVSIEKIFSSSLNFSDKGVLSFLVFSIIVASNIYLSNTKKAYYLISIFIYYCIYSIFTQDWLLKFFSNKLNPFSIMTGNEELTFSALIYKIIIAYLIYQFIVSIRQNTRRK